MLKKSFVIAIAISLIFIPILTVNAEEYDISSNNLSDYISYFYNRYSKHFDNFGLALSSPDYGIEDFQSPNTARQHISLASYYKYRSLLGDIRSDQILKKETLAAYEKISSRPPISLSFADAESFFLIIRILEQKPEILGKDDQEKITNLLKIYLEPGIIAPDTENRAIIAAAHWQYLNNYLLEKEIITDLTHHYYNFLIKNKIDNAVKNCITKDGWYFENNFTDFSPHYHAVSAYMLMIYGDLTGQDLYLATAEKMYQNIKAISFRNGMVEARLGHRPIGLGAQFYLMQGTLGTYFNDPDYSVYLFFASGSRFFTDPDYPDRLEFHSTIENSNPDFHDDYAFADKAELALTIPRLQNIDTEYKFYFDNPITTSADQNFTITNNGKIIWFNRTKNVLGSFGNWSHIFNQNTKYN